MKYHCRRCADDTVESADKRDVDRHVRDAEDDRHDVEAFQLYVGSTPESAVERPIALWRNNVSLPARRSWARFKYARNKIAYGIRSALPVINARES